MHCRLIWLTIVFITFFCAIARGEPVNLVSSAQGQAFTFSHKGQCYAVLPNHVSGRAFFSLKGGNPEREGNGKMTPLTFEDMDLALAVVTGPLANNCQPKWLDLPRDLGRKLPLGGNATLITIRRNGVKESIAVQMQSITYEHIGITPSEPSMRGTIGKGRSGSLLVVGNLPVGIAVNLPTADSKSGTEARVLRLDAIVARLNRYLTGRRTLTDEKISTSAIPGNLAFIVKSWNITPLQPENSPTNLASAAGLPFLTAPLQKLLKLDLQLADNKTQAVREVIIESNVSDGQTTSPKSIGILASNRSDGKRLRTISTGQMSPVGQFAIRVAAQRMQWIMIRIRSVWDPSKPLRIDRIIVR